MTTISIVIGFIGGCILGFRNGIGKWKLLGCLGALIEMLAAMGIIGVVDSAATSTLGRMCASGFGGLLLGHAMGALVGAGAQPQTKDGERTNPNHNSSAQTSIHEDIKP
jgi:hypothetical protein